MTQHVDQDAPVKHGLAVRGGDEVLYLLEGEASELLHDLGRPLHLLTLEGQEGLVSIVQLLEVASTINTQIQHKESFNIKQKPT